MRAFVILLTLLGALAITFAATSSGFYGDPEHPGMCVIRPGVMVPAGTHTAPDDCARIECSESGHAHIATCGVQLAGPGCHLGDFKEPEADYPDCCMRETVCEA